MDYLTQRARELAEKHQLHEPHEIAEKLYDELTPEERDQALRKILPKYIRDSLNNHQRKVFQSVMRSGGEPRIVEREERPKKGVRRPSKSAKVAGIRDWWQEMMASSVHVDGTWKSFGSCTTEDINWMASARRDLADANIAQARQYEELVSLMEEHGVETLQELPKEALSKTLEGAVK